MSCDPLFKISRLTHVILINTLAVQYIYYHNLNRRPSRFQRDAIPGYATSRINCPEIGATLFLKQDTKVTNPAKNTKKALETLYSKNVSVVLCRFIAFPPAT